MSRITEFKRKVLRIDVECGWSTTGLHKQRTKTYVYYLECGDIIRKPSQHAGPGKATKKFMICEYCEERAANKVIEEMINKHYKKGN